MTSPWDEGVFDSTDPRDDYLRLEPYRSDFNEAAMMETEDVALLAAICLRETLAGWARGYVVPSGKPRHLGFGDAGHGFGLFQIDDRGPYKHLPREAPEATPFLQARWACRVLDDARRDLADFREHPLFEVAVVCRYNASLSRVRGALERGEHPDSVTTAGSSGKPDYGSDVLRRRDRLRAKHPERFPPVRVA